jgi:Mrp family chromosome partitioning ATPase
MTTGVDPKDQARLDESLAKIHNRLLVFSGKGGVGKTTVAVNLAAGLARAGLRVGVLDADIHGPNTAKMLGVTQVQPELSEGGKMKPAVSPDGVKVMSMAMLLQTEDAPVVWRGPLKMAVIRQFVTDVEWGELDWLIIDSPPGTGDEPLSVAQLIPATAAVVVTTPQAVALLDSRKALNFAQLLKLRVVGVVENMSGLACPHCGKEIDLFKKDGGAQMAREMLVPLLGRIPIDPAIVDDGDTGRPFVVAQPESAASKAMEQVVRRVIEFAAPKPAKEDK